MELQFTRRTNKQRSALYTNPPGVPTQAAVLLQQAVLLPRQQQHLVVDVRGSRQATPSVPGPDRTGVQLVPLLTHGHKLRDEGVVGLLAAR